MPDYKLTHTGRIKRPSIAQVYEWMKQAWDNIGAVGALAMLLMERKRTNHFNDGDKIENEHQNFDKKDNEFYGFEDE